MHLQRIAVRVGKKLIASFSALCAGVIWAQVEIVDPGPEHDFGPVPLGETYATQNFILRNQGSLPVTLGQVYIDAQVATCAALGCPVASALDFTIDAQAEDCSGKTLAAGESCSVSIAFIPWQPGWRMARLVFPFIAPADTAPHERILKGTGRSEPLDCLLDWAERQYPELFSQPTATFVAEPFYARCYQNGVLCAGADVLASVAAPGAYLYRQGELTHMGSLDALARLVRCPERR